MGEEGEEEEERAEALGRKGGRSAAQGGSKTQFVSNI